MGNPPPTATALLVSSPPVPQGNATRIATDAATVSAFLDAYNAGQRDRALGYLTDDADFSDCTYPTGNWVDNQGKEAVTAWVSARLADHDHLIVASIDDNNPMNAAHHVVGVTYVKRTSDTLRALGFADGMTPPLATKVILTADGQQIQRFANGPVGASRDFVDRVCRPSPRA